MDTAVQKSRLPSPDPLFTALKLSRAFQSFNSEKSSYPGSFFPDFSWSPFFIFKPCLHSFTSIDRREVEELIFIPKSYCEITNHLRSSQCSRRSWKNRFSIGYTIPATMGNCSLALISVSRLLSKWSLLWNLYLCWSVASYVCSIPGHEECFQKTFSEAVLMRAPWKRITSDLSPTATICLDTHSVD